MKKIARYELEFTWNESSHIDAIIYVISSITRYIENVCYKFKMEFRLTRLPSKHLTREGGLLGATEEYLEKKKRKDLESSN